MTAAIGGIHHVTAIAGDPQENVDFYAGILGMRMVKRSVNQDDPGTYHLFYADAGAHPGSDITFFPWPHMGKGRPGTGLVNEVTFAVPPGTLPSWEKRLHSAGVPVRDAGPRFGEGTLSFNDHHGLSLSLTETPRALERPFDAWNRSRVPHAEQIRGIHAVRITQQDAAPTAALGQRLLGMNRSGHEGNWDRFDGRDAWSGHLDIKTTPDVARGAWGVGSVHHVAWRVRDVAEQLALSRAIAGAGLFPTQVIDRFWFHSVYFREPGGVLFELATDGPGFGVDEPPDKLGERLVLPPWLEEHRAPIERALPPIELPEA